MNIGIYFECQKKSGGAYQYALNLLGALKPLSGYSFTVFNISNDFPFAEFEPLPNWRIVNLIPVSPSSPNTINPSGNAPKKSRALKRKLNLAILSLLRFLRLYSLEIYLTRMRAQKRARAFKGHGIDLMLYHGPSELSFLTDIPGFVPIHDINHKLHPEFPELTSLGQWKKREYLIKNIKRTAKKILVNSKTCKEDLVRLYSIEPERIEVMPCPPPSYIDDVVTEENKLRVRTQYGLPDHYVFYPAQFWPHKNHANLLQAWKILKDHGEREHLVLVGSRQELWGEYERVQSLIEKLELSDRVHILGYVPNEAMAPLYQAADAVAMVAAIGFTYPVFEAWRMKRPLVCTDSHESREQVGNAALLVKANNPSDIAEKIRRLLSDEKLGMELVQNGISRLTLENPENLARKVAELLGDYEKKAARLN